MHHLYGHSLGSASGMHSSYIVLKVPKREIFDRSDFPDFLIMKSLCGADFGVKIKKNFKNN